MTNIQEELQDKLKIKVINTPMNMQGELVLDFKNTQSLTITLYPKYNTITSKGDIETIGGTYKVAGIQVVGSQQPAIVGLATGGGVDQDDVARAKINEIIVMLRTHGLIIT